MNKPIGQALTRKNYRAFQAINYSLLADFRESPERASIDTEPKSYFEIGNAYELMIEDRVKGSYLFLDRFFVADLPGAMPENLAAWIENGDDLEQFYKYNKDGVTRNGTSKALHAWLDECQGNPGKMPISKTDYDMLSKMVDNTLKIELLGLTLGELLADAEFQVPITWVDENGIKKKALLDAVVRVVIGGEVYFLPIDFKTAANRVQFFQMLKRKYWVQNVHYMEGFCKKYQNPYDRMIFVFALKDETRVAQSIDIDEQSVEYHQTVYSELCVNLAAWIKAGRPLAGWKEHETVKVFI